MTGLEGFFSGMKATRLTPFLSHLMRTFPMKFNRESGETLYWNYHLTIFFECGLKYESYARNFKDGLRIRDQEIKRGYSGTISEVRIESFDTITRRKLIGEITLN